MADKDLGTLAVDPRKPRKSFPKSRPRPELCDHGCGRAALFCSGKNVWRCAKGKAACPTVKANLTVHIKSHAHIFTAQDRMESAERARRLYGGAGNPIYGTKRSKRTCQKISATRVARATAKGANNPNWKGGVSAQRKPARHADMSTTRYKSWREEVRERDSYTCQVCGKRGGKQHVDHIKPYAWFPDLRYELSNGRVLCVPCHYATYKEVCKLRKEYQ